MSFKFNIQRSFYQPFFYQQHKTLFFIIALRILFFSSRRCRDSASESFELEKFFEVERLTAERKKMPRNAPRALKAENEKKKLPLTNTLTLGRKLPLLIESTLSLTHTQCSMVCLLDDVKGRKLKKWMTKTTTSTQCISTREPTRTQCERN